MVNKTSGAKIETRRIFEEAIIIIQTRNTG